MGQFVRETIESVLNQERVSVEYRVWDGGSTDGTVEILKEYGERLAWCSRADDGASAAIHAGLAQVCAPILGWLNADDVLMPGALRRVIRAFDDNPDAVAVYGSASWIDDQGAVLGPYPVADFEADRLARECFICQPACFFRASAYQAAGGLDPRLQCAFDYDLWIRLAREGRFVRLQEQLACSRMHLSNKTLRQRGEVFQEGMDVLERHYGYVPASWIYSELVWRRDGRDQFFEPHRPSLRAFLASLPTGLHRNPRHRLRYLVDWLTAPDWRGRVSRLSPQSLSR